MNDGRQGAPSGAPRQSSAGWLKRLLRRLAAIFLRSAADEINVERLNRDLLRDRERWKRSRHR